MRKKVINLKEVLMRRNIKKEGKNDFPISSYQSVTCGNPVFTPTHGTTHQSDRLPGLVDTGSPRQNNFIIKNVCGKRNVRNSFYHLPVINSLYKKRHLDKTALIDNHSQFNYRSLWNSVLKLSEFLLLLCGRQKILIWMRNSNELAITFLASWLIGKTVIPVDAGSTIREIAHLMKIIRPDFIVLDDEKKQLIDELICNGSSLITRSEIADTIKTSSEAEKYSNILTSRKQNVIPLILLSSGSSGEPKGIIHSHENIFLIGENYFREFSFIKDSVLLVSRPMSNISGFSEFIGGLLSTATIVVQESMETDLLLSNLKFHLPTYMSLPISSIFELFDHPGFNKSLFARMKFLRTGGNIVSKSLQMRARDTLNIPIIASYGLTECGTVIVNKTKDISKIESMGNKPSKGVRFKIANGQGSVLPSESRGELLIHAPGMFLGYFNDEKNTETKLIDGWLKTGDIVEIDKDGYYWFISRKNDLIAKSTVNISPIEIEVCLLEHKSILMAAAIGVPDKKYFEIPIAFVTCHKNSNITESELNAFLEKRLSVEKIPHQIHIIDRIPLLPTGKVNYQSLKTWYNFNNHNPNVYFNK